MVFVLVLFVGVMFWITNEHIDNVKDDLTREIRKSLAKKE